MKVFISWSGKRSRAVGEVFADWIQCVLQAASPWMSTRDIDRGAVWFTEINDQLKENGVGFICLTQENKTAPWILFEAGALAKGLSSNRICTFLVDLKPADVEEPLAHFNHTLPNKDGMWALVRTLNKCLGAEALGERVLEQVFTMYWSQFQQKFENAVKNNPPTSTPEPRSEQNILEEILATTRAFQQRISRVESHLEQEAHPGFGGFFRANEDDIGTIIAFAGSSLPLQEIADRLLKLGIEPRKAEGILDEVKAIRRSREQTNPGASPS